MTDNMRFRGIAAILVLIPLVLASCMEGLNNVDKISKTSLDPTVSFPLIDSDFGIQDFLTKGKTIGVITDDNNGLITITYKDTLFSQQASGLFTIPDQQSPPIAISGGTIVFPSPGASVVVSQSGTFAFAPSQSEQFDSIRLKTGLLTIDKNSTIPTNTNLVITIPSLKKGSSIFQQTFNFSNTTSQSPSFDISGYSIDLTKGGTTTNTISYSLQATFTDNGQAVGGAASLSVDFKLGSLNFKALYGKFGTPAFQTTRDSVNVDIFDNIKTGVFQLQDPSLTINAINSFGVPAVLDITQIQAVKQDQSVVMLSGQAVSTPNNPYVIGAPATVASGAVKTSIPVNGGNSNLPQFVSSLVHDLVYQFSGQLSSAGVARNFVLDTSRLTLGVDFELPLYGQMSGLTLKKQYSFGGLGIDNVQKSSLTVTTVNDFPLGTYLQLYFVTNTGEVLDSLFTDNKAFIEAAPVDATGVATSSSTVVKTVVLDKAKVNKVNGASFILLEAILSTTNNGTVPIKILDKDKLKVNVGATTSFEYSF
jgi:hypothetical protein